MRRENIFSKDGFYSFVVQSNLLLHREVIEHSTNILRQLFDGRESGTAVNVLDLACGGLPVSIAEVMGRFPEQEFHYTGVDINPDQVENARQFRFPDNVRHVDVQEGSAWDLRDLRLSPPYDLIYIGMNWHHGTPEELYFLGRQVYDLLADGGRLVNHDWYRPDEATYLRRPDCAPDNPAESFLLVERHTLAAAGVPEFGFSEAAWSRTDPDWKAYYINEMARLLTERGGTPDGVVTNSRHISERDYPISAREAEQVLQRAGFEVQRLGYEQSGQPLQEYFAMLVASRR